DSGFVIFSRFDLLTVLKSAEHLKNNVLNDYIEYLEEIEEQVQSYNSLPLDKWDGYSWQGFYNYIQNKLGDGGWGYVANARGGFLGFWWKSIDNLGACAQYLQLEQEKLCFKISVDDERNRTNLKWEWHNRILKAAEDNELLRLIKPVLRNGQTMTVAVAEGDYRRTDSNGKIDLKKTIAVLKDAERVLVNAVAISEI
ncbi:MAG: hypothetical protein ABFD18_00255, partial [Syntrophomonas sp.]